MVPIRRRSQYILLVGVLLLAGCATPSGGTGTTPPLPPTPPQITVANSMLALSHALSGATDALIACRDQQKCSPQDVAAGEAVMAQIATVGKSIDMELMSADPWTSQRTVILKNITDAGITALKSKVSPSTQLIIASVVAIFNNVSLAVGGPAF